MRSKIKINEIRDRVTLYPIIGYNDPITGAPKKTYESIGKPIYAKVRRTLGSEPTTDDKTKVVSNWEITVRIDSIAYKVEDRIVYDVFNMSIKDIQQIDIWYQKLICYHEY